jgi:hypothetical protein
VHFRIAARAAATHTRAPLLERLLTRGAAPSVLEDWRTHAFRIIAPHGPEPPAVATAALGATETPARSVAVATPVHLVAGLSNVILPSEGLLELGNDEADALAADFDRVFGADGLWLVRVRGQLLCLLDAPLEAATSAPEEMLGQDIWTHQPRGVDAARLRRLMSEIEMWLFEQPVNEHRRARGAPVISSLWLWGIGPAGTPPPVQGWTAGEDPLFAGYGGETRYPGAARSGVVTIAHWPGTDAWRVAEQQWLEPSIADLKAGRLDRIELSAGQRCVRVNGANLRRFWRRARPWWETLDVH